MPSQDDRPPVTGGSYRLPFGQLSPLKFEELCLWIVNREGYEKAEHLGESGSEKGRDIVAWKDGRCFALQCKRVERFGAADARKEIKKIRGLPEKEQPDTLEEMQPLFSAVAHGCAAGLHQRAGDEVYWPRISRKNEFYSTNKLGAFSDDLATVAHFFTTPWHPRSGFDGILASRCAELGRLPLTRPGAAA